MPSHPRLRVLTGRARPPARRHVETAADTGARAPSFVRRVYLSADTIANNDRLVTAIEMHAYRVEAYRSMKQVAALLESEPASIILLETSASNASDALDLIRGLDARRRRRVLLLTWRTSGKAMRHFIDAGIVDFQKMPPTISELLLRLELRARDAQLFPLREEPDRRGIVPQLNPLSGSIGPESSGVRLSDREYLLFELLSSHLGTVVSRLEILKRIWGRGADAEARSNIADVYVRYLRVKLAKVAPSLTIRTVRNAGYVLEPRPTKTDMTLA
ncbi:MAG: winged helix-turn-helix domain-containing protein [bacterium]